MNGIEDEREREDDEVELHRPKKWLAPAFPILAGELPWFEEEEPKCLPKFRVLQVGNGSQSFAADLRKLPIRRLPALLAAVAAIFGEGIRTAGGAGDGRVV